MLQCQSRGRPSASAIASGCTQPRGFRLRPQEYYTQQSRSKRRALGGIVGMARLRPATVQAHDCYAVQWCSTPLHHAHHPHAVRHRRPRRGGHLHHLTTRKGAQQEARKGSQHFARCRPGFRWLYSATLAQMTHTSTVVGVVAPPTFRKSANQPLPEGTEAII